jgi:lipopolysaccharide export LptBFGC system permease protein LptF
MSNEVMNLIETLVLAPLIIAISSFLIALISQQTSKIEEKIKDEKAKMMLEIAENVISQAVATVSQTYVDGLKKDGIFDIDAQKKAFEMSKDKIYKLLTTDTLQAVQNNYGDVDEWIVTKIEETINKSK